MFYFAQSMACTIAAGPISLDHEKVRGGERQARIELGKLHLTGAAEAIDVEEEISVCRVVDDVVVAVGGHSADVELTTPQFVRRQAGEHRIVDPDEIDTRPEIGEGVDIARSLTRYHTV